MTKLTDTQLVLLSGASQRRNHLVVLPEPLPAATRTAVTKLLAAALLEEIPAPWKAPRWRNQDEQPLALRITAAGLAAVGIDEPGAEETPQGAAPSAMRTGRGHKKPGKSAATTAARSKPATATPPPADTKQARILDLLRRGNGVTLAELVETTGWQGHSVRGFLSAVVKKKLGLPIISEKGADGERHYHIAALAGAESR